LLGRLPHQGLARLTDRIEQAVGGGPFRALTAIEIAKEGHMLTAGASASRALSMGLVGRTRTSDVLLLFWSGSRDRVKELSRLSDFRACDRL
jgi:hypothetical protein